MSIAHDDGISISVDQTLNLRVRREESFVVREQDWIRLRRRLESLGKSRREFSAVAWACIGVTFSAIFSGLSWAPAYRALPPDQQPEFAWVWPALIALGLLGLLLGAGMFWAAKVTQGATTVTVSELLVDMDDMRGVGDRNGNTAAPVGAPAG